MRQPCIFNATTIYSHDGTFTAEATAGTGADAPKVHITGKWKLSDGVLTETVDSSKPPIFQTGAKSTEKILEITDNFCRYLNDDGKERTKTRDKN
jgi:hypothetical protein